MTASYDTSLTKVLEAKINGGQNAISIEIEGPQTLTFLSQAGFSARRRSRAIVRNSSEHAGTAFRDVF